MNGIILIFLIAMILLCAFVLWTHLTVVYGQDVITPYNTHNKEQYCGFGERVNDNCINIIPQNQPIPVNQIQNLNEVLSK